MPTASEKVINNGAFITPTGSGFELHIHPERLNLGLFIHHTKNGYFALVLRADRPEEPGEDRVSQRFQQVYEALRPLFEGDRETTRENVNTDIIKNIRDNLNAKEPIETMRISDARFCLTTINALVNSIGTGEE